MPRKLLAVLLACLANPLPIAVAFGQTNAPSAEVPVGVGVAAPRLAPWQSFYFYGRPDFDALPATTTPADSLTFRQGAHYVEIATAPPWLVPEVLKLDYDLFYFRVLTVAQNWVEVVVSAWTDERRWVDRHAVTFHPWPDFLLNVAAVEVLDEATNPVRIKPLDHASAVANRPGPLLRPLALRDEWMLVVPVEAADGPTGWIRWRDADRLLIEYSLLM